MRLEEKAEIVEAKRLYDEAWQLIQSLESDGLPPDHEVFDILEVKLAERISRYHDLCNLQPEIMKVAISSGICLN